MKEKIEEFYKQINKDKSINFKYSNIFEHEFQNLCKLRSYILEGTKLYLKDLSYELYSFPMKYLNIVLLPMNGNFFTFNQDLSNYSFKIQYNNNFIRIQINCIINDIFKNITNFSLNSFGGSALGNFLEIKIDEIFRNNNFKKFGFYYYNSRYLFSLVESTKNSSNTIKEHRKDEKNLITQFFNEEFYNKIIDDIDDINNENHFILKDDLYYFSQISFTGRAFDMAVIKREHGNSFILFLYQVSKNKNKELKSRKQYISEANNVVNNLENIYGIKITSIYLTFILPLNTITTKFQEKLKYNNLNYIFFDVNTNKFIDKTTKIEINSLEINDSLLNLKYNLNIYDIQRIITSNDIWENSIKKFLQRKFERVHSKEEKPATLHKIYINELTYLIK